jgi:hypothetical protein
MAMTATNERPTDAPVVAPEVTLASLNEQVSGRVLASQAPRWWWVGFGLSLPCSCCCLFRWGGFSLAVAASRLPKLYHPIFEAQIFERASRDRFVICIEATDPSFDEASVRAAFEQRS